MTDFYEDDENPDDVRAAFDSGYKGITLQTQPQTWGSAVNLLSKAEPVLTAEQIEALRRHFNRPPGD